MTLHPLAILLIAIGLIFVLIIRLRINAFVALILAAMAIGLLSPHIPLAEVMPRITGAFGNVCGANSTSGGIAIVIAMAAIIGQCMMESGAADKIVRVFVRVLGPSRAPWSLLVCGYILAVPVFFDTVFYLLVPLARAMRIRTGRDYLLFVMAICAGGAVTHTMVPPTPGPLAVADRLKVDLGMMIMVGAMVGLPMALAGLAFCYYCNRTMEVPLRETSSLTLEEMERLANEDESRLPSFLMSLAPILLPVLLITANTIVAAAIPRDVAGPTAVLLVSGNPDMAAGMPPTGLLGVMAFLGNPNFALIMSAALSLYLLVRQKKATLTELAKTMETSLASAGLIILITAAGGAFGAMLRDAQAGKELSNLGKDLGLSILPMGFFLACFFKIAQGSSTVAMITTSEIILQIMNTGQPLGFHTVYLATAIASGSLVGSWMNDSGFWVYKAMAGFTESESLKTWTPLLAILGVVGLLMSWLLSNLLPLIDAAATY